MNDDKLFCTCCGENVPYNRITRDRNLETTCVYCGYVLDVRIRERIETVDCVITAEDSPFIRTLLKDLLVKNALARSVVATENGMEFVGAFKKRLTENNPVNLAILDIEMPEMDGIAAARVMRALEETRQTKRTPILFFSSRICDDTLKQQLRHFAPARYVNKGGSDNPGDLADRVDQLVKYLLTEHPAMGK